MLFALPSSQNCRKVHPLWPLGNPSSFMAAVPKITASNSWLGRASSSLALGQLLLEQLSHMLEVVHTFPNRVLSLESLRNNTLDFLSICRFITPGLLQLWVTFSVPSWLFKNAVLVLSLPTEDAFCCCPPPLLKLVLMDDSRNISEDF